MNLRIYLRNRPNSRGECMIYFIVNEEWISTNVKVYPQFWDAAETTNYSTKNFQHEISNYYTTLFFDPQHY